MADINCALSIFNVYEKHLVDILTKPLYHFICEVLANMEIKQKTKMLKEFQAKMKTFVKLDYELLKRYTRSILEKTNKKYAQKMIQSVIISKNKMLMATLKNKKNNIDINIPHTTEFFAKLISEIGKHFHNNPHLICEKTGSMAGLANAKTAMEDLSDIIKRTIDIFVSYDEIIEIYITTVDDEEEEEEDEEPEYEDEEDNSDDEPEYEDEEESDGEQSVADGNDSDNESVQSVDSVESAKSSRSTKQNGGMGDRMPQESEERIHHNQNNDSNSLPFEREESVSLTDDGELPAELNNVPLRMEMNEKPEHEEPSHTSSTNTKKIVFFQDAKSLRR